MRTWWHFLRWWERVHHTDEVTQDALTESTLLDYMRFQSSQERELTGGTINQRVAIVDRALRIGFPGALVRSLRHFSPPTGTERPWASANHGWP